MIKLTWPIIYSFVIFALIFLLFHPTLINSFRYDSDFARDISEIHDITQGQMRLTGPKLSFGGIFTGPYYYYLFAPVMFLFPGKPEALLYFNLIIFALLAAIATWLLSFLNSNKSSPLSLLSVIYLFTTPYFIFSVKNPGNAFTYLPILTLLFLIFPKLSRSSKLIHWALWGFICGVVVNFHLISIIPVFSLFLIYNLFNFKVPNLVKKNIVAIFAFVCSFLPLLLFELRHNFVMTKNTFIDKSYKIFTDNQNLPNPLTSSKNPIQNLALLLNHFSSWTPPNFLYLFIPTLVLLLFLVKKKKIKLSSAVFSLSLASILAILILAFIARSQLAFHYFYPFILMIQVALILLLLKIKNYAYLLIFILIELNLTYWPKQFFTHSNRLISDFRQTSQLIVDNPEIYQIIKNNSFNLFVVRETPLAVLGWEYRYFLKHNKFTPMGIQEYNLSNYLLLIDETDQVNLSSLNSWELDQFGPRQLLLDKEVNRRHLYLFKKS